MGDGLGLLILGPHVDVVLHETAILLLELACKTGVVVCIVVRVHPAVVVVASVRSGSLVVNRVVLHQEVVRSRVVPNSLVALARARVVLLSSLAILPYISLVVLMDALAS